MILLLQAAVCTDANVADLLAALRPHGLVDKHLVHPSVTALYADARAQVRHQGSWLAVCSCMPFWEQAALPLRPSNTSTHIHTQRPLPAIT